MEVNGIAGEMLVGKPVAPPLSLVTQECTKRNKRIDLQPFAAYDNENQEMWE